MSTGPESHVERHLSAAREHLREMREERERQHKRVLAVLEQMRRIEDEVSRETPSNGGIPSQPPETGSTTG
jgi:predicted  nucleic acid-binding Zn-ribbon protein